MLFSEPWRLRRYKVKSKLKRRKKPRRLTIKRHDFITVGARKVRPSKVKARKGRIPTPHNGPAVKGAYQRTRTKFDQVRRDTTWLFIADDGSEDTHEFPLTTYSWTNYEVLTDVVNSSGTNPCDHVKLRAKPMVLQDTARWSNNSPGYAKFMFDPEDFLVDLPTIPADLLANWHGDCLKKATEPIGADTSLANFLIEMRHGLGELIGFVKEIRRLRFDKAFLGVEFGTKPGFNDLKKMALAFYKVTNRIAHLRKTAGEVTPNRFRLDPFTTPRRAWQWDPSVNSEWFHRTLLHYDQTLDVRYRYTSLECYLHLTILTKNNLLYLWDKMAVLDSVIHAIGLDNPVKIIWNAAAWSWLADWFVDLDQFFDQLGGHPFSTQGHDLFKPSALVMVDSWWSVKYRFTAEVEQQLASGTSPKEDEAYGNTTLVEGTKYVRNMGITLPPFRLFKGFDLSPEQSLILGALGTSRFHISKRRNKPSLATRSLLNKQRRERQRVFRDEKRILVPKTHPNGTP